MKTEEPHPHSTAMTTSSGQTLSADEEKGKKKTTYGRVFILFLCTIGFRRDYSECNEIANINQ